MSSKLDEKPPSYLDKLPHNDKIKQRRDACWNRAPIVTSTRTPKGFSHMTLTTVSQMIADKFQVAVDSITVDTKLKEDLNIDSLDSVEMVMELEDKFSISIKDEDAAKFVTVGDIVNYVEAQAK